ncbi:MAG TPA: hypothetical protein VF490_07010 [Chryseosolibacter sp.]
MKLPKIFLLLAFTMAIQLPVSAQTSGITGRWQLVKKSNCMDEAISADADTLQQMRDDMHSRAVAEAQVVSFRDNASAEESTRILSSGRSANQKKFFYKYNGEMLLILDKKSQTISDSYIVEKISSDSLVLSNASRPCEMKFFVKIKDLRAN